MHVALSREGYSRYVGHEGIYSKLEHQDDIIMKRIFCNR